MTTTVTDPSQAPLEFSDQQVLPEWIDFNGHMNVAYYVMAFDHGVDGLTSYLDIGPEGIEARGTSHPPLPSRCIPTTSRNCTWTTPYV